MNLRAARNELGEPPKIGIALLLLEAVGLTVLTVAVVAIFV